MTKPQALIFDLDGTLWDSCPACAIGWANILKRNGLDDSKITPDLVRSVAGKPHAECIEIVFGDLDSELQMKLIAETAIEDKKMIIEHGGVIYDGVEEGLKALAQNYDLYLVSNCQAGYIELFFEKSGYGTYFKDFESWGATGNPKSENIKDVIKRNSIESAVYIGDTQTDCDSAKAAQIPFYFVEYGFGEVTNFEAKFPSFSQLVAHFS